MENASKALLIAGAVLIVIVLISVGMLIVSQANKVTDQTEGITSTQAAQTFNNQFTTYTGVQSGSSVKSLLTLIATNNATNSVSKDHIIDVTITDTKTTTAALGKTNVTADINAKISSIPNTAKYTVVTTTQDSDGYITGISITRN